MITTESRASSDCLERIITGAEIFEPLSPIDMICPGIELAPGAPTILAGEGYGGKSLLAQDLALAVATGTPAWGAFPCKGGRVVHFDFEQGERLTRERYQRLARARALWAPDIGDRLVILPFPRQRLDDPAAEEWLVRKLDGVTLAIIDSFRASCPDIDENSSAARVPLDALGRVSQRTQCAAFVLHHARKGSGDGLGERRHLARGSGAIFDAAQSFLILTPPVTEQTEDDKVKRKGLPALLSLDKARLGGRTFKPMPVTISDVEVGDDPLAGLAVRVTPPLERRALPERLLWALSSSEKPRTANSLREELHCNGKALEGAIATLGEKVAWVPTVVRSKPTEGLVLASNLAN